MTDLLLHNAHVLTMDPARPAAGAVAVRDGRIAAVGPDAKAALAPAHERVDCEGGTIIPGFIDAHVHLLAYAATLRNVDCAAARSIADIQDALRRRAAGTPAGGWVRASGYEETRLAERRHPTRVDLDAAAPEHPVRLVHSSGHARVLNSLALRIAGIDRATEEPPGAVIERDAAGEPTGVLIGMEGAVDRAVPKPPFEELAAFVREASRRLVAAGVTCIQDATHTNGRDTWALYERLFEAGAVDVDVVLLEGAEHLGELPEGGAGGRLRRGAVKVMLHELENSTPDRAELAGMREAVAAAHAAGRQVAVHAVGAGAVEAAVDAIEAALRAQPRDDHRHRIEHCGLLPEGMASRLARLGVVVVVQPSLVAERGDRYLQLVPGDRIETLYAFRTLLDAGVDLAAGSDAPVTSPRPLASLAAAAERRAASGRVVGTSQTVGAGDALRWWTAGAARAAFLEDERGAVRPGLRADLVLLARDPGACSPEELRSLAVRRVWAGGRDVPAAP